MLIDYGADRNFNSNYSGSSWLAGQGVEIGIFIVK
jgi:hypothetical protein